MKKFKKIKNVLKVLGTIVMILILNTLSLANSVYAAELGTSANLENLGSCGSILKYKGNTVITTYVSYNEGIYVGYKYYETRYEDCVLNQGNANGSAGTYDGETNWTYHREVAYPFGFGLSYTTFDQELKSITYKEETDSFVAKINIVDDITNIVVWIIMFEVKKLTSIAIRAPTPNQNIKKPTVAISPIKNNPAIINHICHI